MKRFNKKNLKKALDTAKEGQSTTLNLNGMKVDVKGGLVDYDEFMKEQEEKAKKEEE